MKPENFQFKTNINCSGCVASVKPHLDTLEGITEWEVATTNKDKILTIISVGASKEQVMNTVQNAGFRIELLNQ